MRSLERIVVLCGYCHDVRSSVCLSGTGVQCDYTVHVSADLSLWLDKNILGTRTPKHVYLLPAVFFQFHLKERWSMDVQTRRDISKTVEDRGKVTVECK